MKKVSDVGYSKELCTRINIISQNISCISQPLIYKLLYYINYVFVLSLPTIIYLLTEPLKVERSLIKISWQQGVGKSHMDMGLF